MRRRASLLAAALVAAALSPISTPAAPAAAGVDITPPVVGSCHDLTHREAARKSDPSEPVDCATEHTTMTVAVITVAEPSLKLPGSVYVKCLSAMAEALGGRQKALELSAYGIRLFIPTQAQRDAGADWVRCDVVLAGGRRLQQLPTDGPPSLGSLPLPRDVARCWLQTDRWMLTTVCSRPHDFRAKVAVAHADGSYPGMKTFNKWALKKCAARMRPGFWYTWPSRIGWKAGGRHAVCYQPTSGGVDGTAAPAASSASHVTSDPAVAFRG